LEGAGNNLAVLKDELDGSIYVVVSIMKSYDDDDSLTCPQGQGNAPKRQSSSVASGITSWICRASGTHKQGLGTNLLDLLECGLVRSIVMVLGVGHVECVKLEAKHIPVVLLLSAASVYLNEDES
jgi:hypothetical protein